MSDIIVKFKPQGNRALVRAIEELQAATQKYGGTIPRANKEAMKLTGTLKAQNLTWKKLGVSTRTLRQAYRGNITALERMRVAMAKAGIAGKGMLRNNRLLDNSFATMRSHMLLFSFAMSLGVRQMLDFQKQAGKLKAMETGFNTLSGGVGNAAISMAKLKAATNGTMSEMSLFQQANSAMILGVTKNSDEMAEMFDMAQRLGRTLGVDTERSIESLVTGLGRQSVKMLDNIGIIVKSNEAYEDYAEANNLVASELTDSEKRQAFFNAALESGRKKMKALGPEVSTAQDSFDRFNVTMSELGTEFGELTSPAVAGFMDEFSDWVFNLSAGPLEKMAKDMGDLGIQLKDFEGFSQRLADELSLKELDELEASTGDLFRRINLNFENLGPDPNAIKDLKDNMGEDALINALFPSHIKMAASAMTWNQQARGIVKDMLTKFGVNFKEDLIDPSTIDVELINKEFEKVIAEIGKKMGESTSELDKEGRIQLLKEIREGGFTDDEALQREVAALAAEGDMLAILIALGTEYKNIMKDVSVQTEDFDEKTKNAAEAMRLLSAQMKAINQMGKGFSALAKELGASAQAVAAIQAAAALVNSHLAATQVLADEKIKPTWLKYAAAAAMYAEGIAHVLAIRKVGASMGSGSAVGQYAEGGYVGGRPHSQGGTIIEAERGEFVMSRNAVESIGLETLSMMNEGGGGSVNVTVTGNVMTQDFVEGELAESIKEAVRRGSDFGIS